MKKEAGPHALVQTDARLSAIVQTDSLPSIMCITDTEPAHSASQYVMVPWGTTFYEKAPSLNMKYGKFPIASKKIMISFNICLSDV